MAPQERQAGLSSRPSTSDTSPRGPILTELARTQDKRRINENAQSNENLHESPAGR